MINSSCNSSEFYENDSIENENAKKKKKKKRHFQISEINNKICSRLNI